MFIPTRVFARERLKSFAPKAGIEYAQQRNFDTGQSGNVSVSQLSPYIRRRVLSETEVITCVLAHHSPQDAAKFLDEVFWRAYWKGWLEMRPQIWSEYQNALAQRFQDIQTQSGLRQKWRDACMGETGIDGFDHWAKDLVQTGYLHNHARMWFASIWIHTLQLPWELGADFFMRHLFDGDPASNTLSWRWVAGLHTVGKAYLATRNNIEKFTNGRFSPDGLVQEMPVLPDFDLPELKKITWPTSTKRPKGQIGFLFHDDHLGINPEIANAPVAYINTAKDLSPMEVSENLVNFVDGLIQDHQNRNSIDRFETCQSVSDIVIWAVKSGINQVVTPFPALGPNRDMVTELDNQLMRHGIDLIQTVDPYDQLTWPKATHGFFKFKNNIGNFLEEIEKGR